jgi:lauroyl/myristoyl acyltransferase
MMYHFFRLAAKIVPRLPRWFLRILPVLIGPLAWLVARGARRQSTINVRHILGLEAPPTLAERRKVQRIVRGVFRHSIINYLNAFSMPFLTQEEVVQSLSTVHEEYITEALALGKGAILFSAHFGPFEYLASWFTARGYEVVIPVEKLKDERMLRLMVDLRSSSGVNFLPLGGSVPMRTIIQTLRKNQIIIIAADRAIEGTSVIRNFFNAPARLPIGPVNLSLRTGAPLVGAFAWRTSETHIDGEFTHLTLALSEEERKQPDVIEAALIKQMEGFISAHPEQWAVFEPVWVKPDEEHLSV